MNPDPTGSESGNGVLVLLIPSTWTESSPVEVRLTAAFSGSTEERSTL